MRMVKETISIVNPNMVKKNIKKRKKINFGLNKILKYGKVESKINKVRTKNIAMRILFKVISLLFISFPQPKKHVNESD